ncbi:hypothetical protein MATL_G00003820 [Megalops atlanticus]|uniref:Fringe-like glycosyltransferase domain-containing protein n=1 Tax=Megalops atlanticus TaxID=7932 RepID=A0A9D3TDV7_MEGAT|nr:hypothetical protein MATL_G00003820 [Megalops atlanticus]
MAMLVKKAIRTLSGATLTFLIIVLVDLRLRARHPQKHNVSVYRGGPGFVHGPVQELRPPGREGEPKALGKLLDLAKSPRATTVLNQSSSELYKEIRDRKQRLRIVDIRRRKPAVLPGVPLQLTDIFIAVKTTGRFHSTRLALLLETWISRTKEHTYIFTDAEDEDNASKGYNIIVTNCSPEHSHQALSCKMSAEYDFFMASDKNALLSLLSAFPPDSDIYVGKPSLDHPIRAHELLENNKTREVEFWFATGGAGFCISRRLAEKMAPWASGPRFEQTSAVIRLPDDCTVGFIVEKRLGIPMVHSPMFHSHLENLLLLTPSNIPLQVTLSYGLFEKKLNSVELKGTFSKEEDPSRFKTVHCLLYPVTNWCP